MDSHAQDPFAPLARRTKAPRNGVVCPRRPRLNQRAIDRSVKIQASGSVNNESAKYFLHRP